MSKKNIKNKRIQISFPIRKDKEEEFVLNFLDSLSPSRRARLVMHLLKKYVQTQMNQKGGNIEIYTKLNEIKNKTEPIENEEEENIDKTKKSFSQEIIREIGETPKELKPVTEKENLEENINFENKLKIARVNIGLLNKNRK